MFNKRNTTYKSSLEYEPLLPDNAYIDSGKDKLIMILMSLAMLIAGAGILFSVYLLTTIFYSVPVIY